MALMAWQFSSLISGTADSGQMSRSGWLVASAVSFWARNFWNINASDPGSQMTVCGMLGWMSVTRRESLAGVP